MQITLNKVPFDVAPVAGPLRQALLADPAIRGGLSREVWAWDREAGKGRALVPQTPQGGVPLPTGLMCFVAAPGLNGQGPHKADGPTRRMAERLMAAVGAKSFGQVMQAIARVTGVPQHKAPRAAFAALDPLLSYRVVMEVDMQALELANAARNLQAFLLLPGLVLYRHATDEAAEGAPAPGSIRPGFVIPPMTQAALMMRRLAVARRLSEMQAALGGARPADLPADDPRRLEAAKLGAEWKALQPKPQAA